MPDPKAYVNTRIKEARLGIERSMGEDFLRELERIFLISRQIMAGKMRAERKTKKVGSGLEFSEHREYVPGDDFRTIDWNLYGRLEKLFVRLYEEEEDIPVYVLFDVSASMLMGTPIKAVHAFQLASALSYVSLAHLDRATMIPFSASLESLPPPGRGKGRMFKMFHMIRQAPLGGVTDLEQTARSFVYRRPRRGKVVVISDFLSTRGYEDAINLLRYQKYSPIVIQTLSPQELSPTLNGDIELLDVETGALKSITVTRNLLRAYKQELTSFTDNIKRFCQDRSIPYFLSVSDERLEDLMLGVFRKGGFLK
ncbi:DUF58 domain-containing protein [Myxococcota bacterium]|nr:DUF58 domain-containing protein [Myxococcota bacterium]MBU1537012.1 DUF58 domain-containing protein [Myxococcota bacterium]